MLRFTPQILAKIYMRHYGEIVKHNRWWCLEPHRLREQKKRATDALINAVAIHVV